MWQNCPRKEGGPWSVLSFYIPEKKKMCRKLKKMYFPAEMLKLMLCMHERLLQEAPCQRGMTNKENLCSELAPLSCICCKGGRGTRPSSRAAVWPVAALREGGLLVTVELR